MENYFESECIIVKYSKAVNTIIAIWKTPPLSEEFRTGMETMLRAMAHFKTGKIVADTVYMGAVHPDDQEWVASDWYNRAAKTGFSHNAIVVPADIFTEMSVEAILNRVENNVAAISYFPNVDEAIAWIGKF
jgi:hypothetical protein